MYRITITKVEEKQVTRRGEWTVVDKRPWTQKELSDSCYAGTREDDFLKSRPLKEVQGHAPDTTETREQEIEILKQNVETLDVASVIKAINGL
jgi:hypothetical protein